MKARYVYDSNAINYIPESNVAAGDVVFVGKVCGCAKLDIKAGELGALATTGVYEVEKDSNAISLGAAVYWDGTNKKATATPNANFMGTCVAAAAASATVAMVMINAGGAADGSNSGSNS